MPTTIQIQDRTLEILRKLKYETNSSSYDETIKKLAISSGKKESLAGYLGRKPAKFIMKDLRDKNDRV